jgi:hypothetical protein
MLKILLIAHIDIDRATPSRRRARRDFTVVAAADPPTGIARAQNGIDRRNGTINDALWPPGP